MTQYELRERLKMLVPQLDTLAIMDEFTRLQRIEERCRRYETVPPGDFSLVSKSEVERLRSLEEQLEAAQDALDRVVKEYHYREPDWTAHDLQLPFRMKEHALKALASSPASRQEEAR